MRLDYAKDSGFKSRLSFAFKKSKFVGVYDCNLMMNLLH